MQCHWHILDLVAIKKDVSYNTIADKMFTDA